MVYHKHVIYAVEYKNINTCNIKRISIVLFYLIEVLSTNNCCYSSVIIVEKGIEDEHLVSMIQLSFSITKDMLALAASYTPIFFFSKIDVPFSYYFKYTELCMDF